MNIDKGVLIMAGTVILITVLLGWLNSGYWFLLTAFVGANLIQSGFTGFCPASMILKAFGVKPGKAFE
ncbi:MAG: DUF2892 domain-containing protein [Thermodesulfobacteriota bacterium]|nr:DUF2892 domain-containing protein [Thermodesulfobacteriota bacterium]